MSCWLGLMRWKASTSGTSSRWQPARTSFPPWRTKWRIKLLRLRSWLPRCSLKAKLWPNRPNTIKRSLIKSLYKTMAQQDWAWIQTQTINCLPPQSRQSKMSNIRNSRLNSNSFKKIQHRGCKHWRHLSQIRLSSKIASFRGNCSVECKNWKSAVLSRSCS